MRAGRHGAKAGCLSRLTDEHLVSDKTPEASVPAGVCRFLPLFGQGVGGLNTPARSNFSMPSSG